MIDPKLETFVLVAECGSFNKAANEAYISPSAIIKQINALENALDLKLLVRTHKGLALTPAGKSLYEDAKYLIQYVEKAKERAEKAMLEKDDVIRIGTSPMTPPQFLVDIWPRIYKKNPNLKYRFVPFENTPENAREILLNLGQNIDIVFGIFDEGLLDYRHCKATKLEQLPLCLGVSVNHPLARKDRLSFEDLKDETILMISRNRWKSMDDLRDDIQKNHPEIKIEDFDFYCTEVFNQCELENKLLVCVDKWKYVHPLMKIIPVDWDHSTPFGVFHPENPPIKVDQFIEELKEQLTHTSK